MITIHNVEQGSQEWHELRKKYFVTASNALTLLKKGKNSCSSKNHNDSFAGNYWTRRGHSLEDQASQIFQAVYNVPLVKYGFVTNDKYPNAGASPDDVIPLQAIVEYKAFDKDLHLACLKDLPNSIYCQTQFNMMIMEVDVGYPTFINPNIEDPALCFKRWTVYKDDLLIKRFKKALNA